MAANELAVAFYAAPPLPGPCCSICLGISVLKHGVEMVLNDADFTMPYNGKASLL
jgi:hypothetical protein